MMKNLVLFVALFGAVFAGLSISDISVSPDPILPGGAGTITATISSSVSLSATGSIISGGEELTSVRVKFLGATLGIDKIIELGDIDAGSSTQVSIPIRVPEDANSGNYLVKLTADGWTGSTFNEKSATLVIDVLNPVRLNLVSADPVIGEKEEIELEIRNEGGAASNLILSVGGDFAIGGQNEVYVGDVDESTMVKFVLDSTSANPGANDVEFTLTYNNELGEEKEVTKTLRLNIVKQDSVVTIVQNTEIISSKENTIGITVKNTGKNVNDLKISFPNQDIRLKEFEKIEVGSLSADQQRDLEVLAFVDLNPGINQIEALIEWKENGEEKSDTINVPLTISSDAQIGIFLEAKPSPLRAGEETTLSVLVSNLGSFKINNVEVGIESNSLTILDVEASDYIGEMDADDFSAVQFKIMPTQTGEQDLKIKIKYKDQSGEWINQEINRTVVVQNPAGGDGLGTLLLLIVIAGGVGVWYFKFRKKK